MGTVNTPNIIFSQTNSLSQVYFETDCFVSVKNSPQSYSAYHPLTMLQILVYAYLRNIYSNRRTRI